MTIIIGAAASLVPESADDMLTEEQIAPLLGTECQTLANWRSQRKGPPYYKVGRLVRYRRRDVQVWLSARLIACERDLDTAAADKEAGGRV